MDSSDDSIPVNRSPHRRSAASVRDESSQGKGVGDRKGEEHGGGGGGSGGGGGGGEDVLTVDDSAMELQTVHVAHESRDICTR
ncbi:hypothetical protein V1478_008303 [Vespula squamosa]|uniref:Uncharacterized protein n=1 Tax=Vespula squamosa TaxID=30214 RepID=A0ABD2B101_VESSQ